MSLRTLETAICIEARDILNNRKLRIKDLLEWSTGAVTASDGEIVIKTSLAYVCVKAEHDKRKPQS